MTRIYLVDDHAILRDGLRALLEAGGHEVVGEAGDVDGALAGLAALQPPPQLLLLDMSLAGRSGLEVLSALRARGPVPPTLMLTMSALPRHVAESVRGGALGYVLKGASATELLRAVATVAAGRQFLGAGVVDLLMQAEAAASSDPLATLSPREREILRLVVQGRTSAAIGTQLGLSPKTVDTYRSRLMAKLGVGDVVELVRLAYRTGLMDDEGV